MVSKTARGVTKVFERKIQFTNNKAQGHKNNTYH